MITPPKQFASKGERLVVPAGSYQAVCYDVWDLGWQVQKWEGKEKLLPKVILAFEISKKIEKGDYMGKRYTVSQKYTFSLNDKATLAKHLESWLGKKLNDAERKSFDLETLIGKNCLIGIAHNISGDKTYVNISSIMPMFEGMPAMTPENPRNIPEWVIKIKANAKDHMTWEPSDQREMEAQCAAEEHEVVVKEEEEIPF